MHFLSVLQKKYNVSIFLISDLLYQQYKKSNYGLSIFLIRYLQPIINQYFANNKSEIWLWSLMIHSKGRRFNGFINS